MTRILAPAARPDIVEVGGFFMYNGEYVDDHCCNGTTQLRLPGAGLYRWHVVNCARLAGLDRWHVVHCARLPGARASIVCTS